MSRTSALWLRWNVISAPTWMQWGLDSTMNRPLLAPMILMSSDFKAARIRVLNTNGKYRLRDVTSIAPWLRWLDLGLDHFRDQ